jgi:DNA helicase-2/ATP-dependent DNA helicase PcrA
VVFAFRKHSAARNRDIVMTNTPEIEERNHLETIKARLRSAIDKIDALIRRYAQENDEMKRYAWEYNADMDKYEKQWARKSVYLSALTGENAVAAKERLHRLMLSPYFGRFDFIQQGAAKPLQVYLGIHGFADEAGNTPLVYDWRAPVSTMFYDFETGPARYVAPAGEVAGQITLKRQYRIRDGHMEFMIESAVSVMDTVLQEELSRTSDNRMRNIVATIQRDQNAIVRNENAYVLIIQGVAGSGKTSLALHRIAYLLYRFRDRLTSRDILILSSWISYFHSHAGLDGLYSNCHFRARSFKNKSKK